MQYFPHHERAISLNLVSPRRASTVFRGPAVIATTEVSMNPKFDQVRERVRPDARKQWDKDPDIRDEFDNDFDSYLAYRAATASGNTKVLKGQVHNA